MLTEREKINYALALEMSCKQTLAFHSLRIVGGRLRVYRIFELWGHRLNNVNIGGDAV